MKKGLIILFIFIISIFIFWYGKKDKEIESSKDIAFYYENDTGSYEQSTDSKWNSGDYALNVQNSICNGVKNPNYLSWNNDTNEVILNSVNSTRCTLYFDKKRQYTLLSGYPIEGSELKLTNLVKNGNYDQESDDWILRNNVELVDDVTGNNKILQFESNIDVSKGGAHSYQVVSCPIYNHSYYARLNFKSNSTFSSEDARLDLSEGSPCGFTLLQKQNVKAIDWTLLSNIVTQTLDIQGTLRLRNFVVMGNSYAYTDEIMIIDLTESYGDNIPTKEELDNTLIYFDDTVYMKSVMGLQGEFKVTGVSDNQEIECNNDGQAKISNGVVTITGDSPYITCYLK